MSRKAIGNYRPYSLDWAVYIILCIYSVLRIPCSKRKDINLSPPTTKVKESKCEVAVSQPWPVGARRKQDKPLRITRNPVAKDIGSQNSNCLACRD